MDIQGIIKGCIANDRRSQEKLYRMYFDKMLNMCMRYTGDLDRAALIVNNGYLKVFKSIGSFEQRGSIEAWIRRIVFNSISDYFRKENKYLKFLILDEKESKIPELAESNLYYEDVIKMIDRLPNQTKNVFVLYAIEGFSHKEIGIQLNISDSTSKWHLSQAREKLKNILEEQQENFIKHG